MTQLIENPRDFACHDLEKKTKRDLSKIFLLGSSQFISLVFLLTCLLIVLPFYSGSAITSLGDYFYVDSNGVKQTGTFYSFKP